MSDIYWAAGPQGARIPFAVFGSGSEPRLVFGHSLTAAGTTAEGFYRPALERGWSVASPDLRGHGISVASSFELEEWGADLLAVLDACGWERAWLGGGSLGAAVAVTAAGLAPDRVEGLLLIAPAHGTEVNPALADFGKYASSEGYANQEPAAVAAMLGAVAGWTLDLGPLAVIDGPVKVLAWTDDPVHPQAAAGAIAAAAPRGRLELIDPRELAGDPAILLERVLEIPCESGPKQLLAEEAAQRPHVPTRV